MPLGAILVKSVQNRAGDFIGLANFAEYFRTPDDGIFGLSPLVSMGQWLSLPMILLGVAMLVWSSRTRR